jgi:hypothetical protein
MVKPWHVHAAASIGYEYRADTLALVPGRPLFWDKIDRINKAIADAADGDLVVWMDSDCIIRKPTDFNQALPPEANLGLVKAVDGWFNGGVHIVRVCPATRAFYTEHFRRGPVLPDERAREPGAMGRAGGDDSRTNQMLHRGFNGIVAHSVERKWNCSRITPAPHMEPLDRLKYPLVEGFHCEAHRTKLVLMADRLGLVRKQNGWNPA